MSSSVIIGRMRWTHRLESKVYSGTRLKGHRYFKQGRAHIEFGGKGEVRGSVTGSEEYEVGIQLQGEAAVASCECFSFEDGSICKHIWAMLLQAEAEGYLTPIANAWNPAIQHEWADEEDESPDDYDFPYAGLATPPKMAPKPAAPVVPWKEHLSALRRVSTVGNAPVAEETPRRILYVVDVQECLTARMLVLQAVASRKKKNGEWGRPNFQETYISNVSGLDAADQQILALLSGSMTAYGNGYNVLAPSISTRRRLASGALDILIPLISATGRFFLRPKTDGPAPADLLPLQWDDGPPWSFRMSVQREAGVDSNSESYVIRGLLRRPSEERGIADPELLVPGLVFFSDRAARFDDACAFEWIALLRREGSMVIPAAHRADFLTEIVKFPKLPPIELPEELRIENRTPAGPPHVAIRPIKDSWRAQQKLQCEITFDYGSAKVSAGEPSECIHDSSSDRYFLRDRQAESAAIQRLQDFGVRRSSWNPSTAQWELPASRLPALVRTFVAEGWRIEAEGQLYRRAGGFNIRVTSGIDWLELQGSAEFEGQTVELPELLKAIGRGEKMVRLGDGSFGLLPEEWLERYRFVAGLGSSGNGEIRFKRGQAGLLDALLTAQPEVTFDEGFLRLRRELETFGGVKAADPPHTFAGTLRGYQREGLGWMRFVRQFGFGGCLADDMGLGKTVQVIALLDSDERRGPALVVVPRSLVFNWKQEASRFAPRLRVLDFTGPGRKDRWNEVQEHDLILTTYGTMRRDAPQLKDIHFDTIILDEAQSIKNASTESAKAARLLNANHRLALTGTPIENHLSDLWSLFEFLNPGLLGSASVFKMQTNGTVANESAQILSKALRPFILRRTKEQVARELPAKTEQTISCELDKTQRHLYDELRRHYRAALLGKIEEFGIEKSRMQILEALLRLRQAACHPGLIDKARSGEPSAKLEALIPQLQEVAEGGHKALVFSQFTTFLSIVRSRLDAENVSYEYLDGRTRNRESRVRRFQEDPDCRLFLISLKAGGLGLNLTAAEYVFLLDPWWNPAIEAQAIDRTHRIGQSRRVFAYRLIAKDTIEEKVLDLQKSKRQLANAIITAENSALAGLDRETLEVLLS